MLYIASSIYIYSGRLFCLICLMSWFFPIFMGENVKHNGDFFGYFLLPLCLMIFDFSHTLGKKWWFISILFFVWFVFSSVLNCNLNLNCDLSPIFTYLLIECLFVSNIRSMSNYSSLYICSFEHLYYRTFVLSNFCLYFIPYQTIIRSFIDCQRTSIL